MTGMESRLDIWDLEMRDEQALRGSGEFLFRFSPFPCGKTGRGDFRSREIFLGRFLGHIFIGICGFENASFFRRSGSF